MSQPAKNNMQEVDHSEGDEARFIQRSCLLRLPKELQLTIWEFALTECDLIPFFTSSTAGPANEDDHQTNRRLRWYIPPLLQTCHSCRMEGLPIFYSSNTFVLRHETTLDGYQQARSIFNQYCHYLLLITDFGIEYKLPSSNTFLLRGRRKLVGNEYIFEFSSDAAPSHHRPLTALEASETDNCLCMVHSMVKKRKYSTLNDYTDAMIAFLASFSEKMSRNELRVLRYCRECGKKMIEQKPRKPYWTDIPPTPIPVQSVEDY